MQNKKHIEKLKKLVDEHGLNYASKLLGISKLKLARLYRFTTTLGILPLDCPNLGYKANDIVSVSILDSILNNFCCSCYPSGSGTRIVSFNGVQCKQIGSNC